jgi:uncharacterized Zn finger protein
LVETGAAETGLRAVAAALERNEARIEYERAPLAAWLRDTAAAQGARDLALQGAREVVRAAPTLRDYRRAQELAGDKWPALREELLAVARRWKHYDQAGAVDILLHEKETGAALELVKSSPDYRLLERVTDAALENHPQEVAAICRKQAEAIMDAGKSEYYEVAARWLRRAKAAQQKAGETAQWSEYLERLIAQHAKKWKLRPMLEALRS